MEENSVLANSAYTFNDNDGSINETLKEIESYGLEGYSIDKDLSDDESLVFINPQGEEITLAIRGTDPNKFDREDMYANYLIVSGKEKASERFTGEYDKMIQIMSKYPDKKYKVTGHSLGGHISYKLGKEFNIEGHHFNAGAFVSDAFENMASLIDCGKSCEALEKQNFYTTAIDPLSVMNLHPLLDKFGKQNIHYQYRPEVGKLGHSINHFLPEKKGQKMSGVIYNSPYELYKDLQEKGFIQMELKPRVRDYCAVNPLDPKCPKLDRLGNR